MSYECPLVAHPTTKGPIHFAVPFNGLTSTLTTPQWVSGDDLWSFGGITRCSVANCSKSTFLIQLHGLGMVLRIRFEGN